MQQDLEDLLLFEHTISQMFDSETRIALAVLEVDIIGWEADIEELELEED